MKEEEDDDDDDDDEVVGVVKPIDCSVEVGDIYEGEGPFALRKFVLSLLGLVFSWILSSYTITLADERTPDPTKYRPLPDIFIDNVTRVPWAATVSELIIVAFTLTFVTLVIFHRYRFLILKRCCVILSSLYIFRAITIWVTSLPVIGTHLNCLTHKPNTLSDRLERAVHVLMSQGMDMYGSRMCGDYIFSGHACMQVVLAHFITQYSPSPHALVTRIVVWSTCGFGVICILAAHFHYTVDVILAVVISSRLFVYYHALCQCPNLFQHSVRQTLLYQIPLFYLFENEHTCSLREKVNNNCAFHVPKLFENLIQSIRKQRTTSHSNVQVVEQPQPTLLVVITTTTSSSSSTTTTRNQHS